MKIIQLLCLVASGHAQLRIEHDPGTVRRLGATTKASLRDVLDENYSLEDLQFVTFTGIHEEEEVEYVVSQVKHRQTDDGDDVTWEGISQVEVGSATLLQTHDGFLSGSLTTPRYTYSISTLPDGTLEITANTWDQFADTEALEYDENRNEVESSSLVAEYHSRPDSVRRFLVKHDSRRALWGKVFNRTLADNEVTDVMIIVTPGALCGFSGRPFNCDPSSEAVRRPMEAQIELMQEQTNTALSGAGVPAEVRIVDTVFLREYDGRPGTSTLNVLLRDGNVAQWREDAGADLVAIVTDRDPRGRTCGIAYLGLYVSATSFTCFDSFTLTHELDNFGANHERRSVPDSQLHPYGHGYIPANNRYRTIMAYPCPRESIFSSSCPTVPYFSANGLRDPQGNLLGNVTHDNARLIRENAARVANFVPQVVPTDGPTPTPNPVGTPPNTPTLVPPPPATTRAPTPRTPAPVPPTPPTSTSCPATVECPTSNLMHRRLFGLCFYEGCVSERQYSSARRFWGLRCGPC